MEPLLIELKKAVESFGKQRGLDLSLNRYNSVGLMSTETQTEVVVEWIEQAECVAVHSIFPLPESAPRPQVWEALLRSHLGGVGTMGCAFWLGPDEKVRVGLTLVGPTLTSLELSEAVERVAFAASKLVRQF